MSRAAVIDIGSSSIKLLIAEQNDKEIKVLESLKNILPVGRYAFLQGRISQEIVNQTVELLEKYKTVIKEYDVQTVRVIATTAVREARNKDIFADTVALRTGFTIEVLNVGDVVYYIDAYLSHKLKKAYPIHEKNLLIVELGAGSLDISLMEKGRALMNVGFPIGTLRLRQFRNRVEGTAEETTEAVQEYIENRLYYLKQMLPKIRIDDVILIDESYSVYLQNILPNKKRESNFFRFAESESEELSARLSERNLDEWMDTFQLPAEIAEGIDSYALIVKALFKLTQKRHIYIMETSLSEAIIASILFGLELSQESNRAQQLVSMANFICERFQMDLAHLKQVAGICEVLFTAFREPLGLTEADGLYLTLAAYLHDLGMFINNRSHHKHSEYIINALNLFRLTEEEVKIIACVGRYHRKSSPLPTHLSYSSLGPNKQILVQKLSSLLRIANALDGSHKQKVKKCEVRFNKKQDVTLIVDTNDSFVLEKVFFNERKRQFEEITGNRITLVTRNAG